MCGGGRGNGNGNGQRTWDREIATKRKQHFSTGHLDTGTVFCHGRHGVLNTSRARNAGCGNNSCALGHHPVIWGGTHNTQPATQTTHLCCGDDATFGTALKLLAVTTSGGGVLGPRPQPHPPSPLRAGLATPGRCFRSRRLLRTLRTTTTPTTTPTSNAPPPTPIAISTVLDSHDGHADESTAAVTTLGVGENDDVDGVSATSSRTSTTHAAPRPTKPAAHTLQSAPV